MQGIKQKNGVSPVFCVLTIVVVLRCVFALIIVLIAVLVTVLVLILILVLIFVLIVLIVVLIAVLVLILVLVLVHFVFHIFLLFRRAVEDSMRTLIKNMRLFLLFWHACDTMTVENAGRYHTWVL